jgi:hypothetical protein
VHKPLTCIGGPRIKGKDGKTDMTASRKKWTAEQIYRADRTTVITDKELDEALENADQIEKLYFRLRAKATISLIRLSGKRRGEVAMIPLTNFKVVPPFLEATFILEKKRTDINLSKVSTKRYSLTDQLTQHILEYLAYLEKLNPIPKFFLPSGKVIFGKYVMYPNEHLSGRQVFNLIRDNSQKIWPHLGRETAAYDVVQTDNSINGIFKVQQALDLSSFATAFNYVKRFSKQEVKRQTVTP